MNGKLIDKVVDEMYHQYEQMSREIETRVECLVRSPAIGKPIEGPITKSKLRIRGITAIVYSFNMECTGIIQRGKFVPFLEVPENNETNIKRTNGKTYNGNNDKK